MTTFTRHIELDSPIDEVWPLLAEPDGWERWLADAADVDVRPGGGGRVVEDGVTREVEVDAVVPRSRVAFRWWPEDDARDTSHVELTVVPSGRRTTVVITETRLDGTEQSRGIYARACAAMAVGSVAQSASAGATVAPTAGLRLWLATSSLVRA